LRPVWVSITDFVQSVFDKIPITTLLDQGLDIQYVQMETRNGTVIGGPPPIVNL
jgi:hypothetical protein